MNGMRILRGSLGNWLSRLFERVFLGRLLRQTYMVMVGHIYFQTLSAAVQFDLFSLLARHKRLSRKEICSLIGIDEKPARILLLGCTTLGLVRRHGDGTYSNSRLAGRLLDKEQPRNILAVIKWQHFINYRAMYHFADAIKSNRNAGLETLSGEGATLYERLTGHPELERIFQDAMQAISVQANHLLAEAVNFSRFRQLLDVGGGNATNIINLARRHADLKAMVFDAPSVCSIAEKNIQEAGMADRLGTSSGDCFKDPFPKGVDCVLFAHFMTIWSEERNRELLKKAYEALPAGGAVIVFNMMQDDDEKGPLSAAAGAPYFLTLATGEGMLYTWSEYEAWVREAGFSKVIRRRLIRDHGIIIGIK